MMIRLRFVPAFASCLLLYFTLTAQTSSLRIIGQTARIPLELTAPQESLTLCDLTPGKTYSLRLVAETPADTKPRLSYGKGAKETVLSLTPSSPCETVTAHLPASFRGYLSARCDECIPSAAEKLLMGITPTINNDGNFLVQEVFIGGGCFDIANVTQRGSNFQLGTFTNGLTSIGIEEGVILSSGNVTSAAGPNSSSSTTGGGGSGGDPDLQQLTSSNINNVVALEFEFTPTIDQVSFEYVFASEEYCEFVNSAFNDVFGFFISGPGINGPFSGNAANIALLPGTATYVSINNVNGTTNATYYQNNLNPGQHACNNAPPVAYNLIEYDGFTKVLTAVANVIPCETYHIKLVLADVGDASYDSAVFLKANSFNAGAYATGTVVASGNSAADDSPYEGCGNASITFSRNNSDLSEPFEVNYSISPTSTATPGVDYTALPPSVVIPPGQSEITVFMTIFDDNIPEGVETVIIELADPCSCTDGTVEIYITDPPPLEVSMAPLIACSGQELTITPDIIGGVPGYTYNWSNGSTNPSLTVIPPPGISYYSVSVTDDCGQTGTATVEVAADAPSAMISGQGTVCQGNFNTYLQVEFTGLGPWTITYEVDGLQETISNISANPLNLPVSLPGTYTLLAVSSNGCPGAVSGLGEVLTDEVTVTPTINDVSCFGAGDGSIQLEASGGNGPYNYNWAGSVPDQAAIDNLAPGVYQYTVTDVNGCQATDFIALGEPNELSLNLEAIQHINCANPDGGSIDVTADGGTGSFSFLWNNGANQPIIDELAPGTYTVTVTDVLGCTAELSATVENNTTPPAAVIQNPVVLSCDIGIVDLNGQPSSSGPAITYQWSTGEGNIIGGASAATAQANAPGIYTLIVTDNSNFCSDTAQVEVFQNIETPVATVEPDGLLTCTTTSLTLNGAGSSSGPNFNYQWTTPNGSIISGSQSLHPQVDQPGTYQLSVTNTDNGCSATAQLVVTEDVTPPVIDIQSPGELNCVQTLISLDASASSTGPAFQFSWTTPDGNIAGPADAPVTDIDQPGIYLLEVLNTGNGCSTADSVMITQNIEIPVAEAGPPSELDCQSSSAALNGTGSSTGSSISYQWTTANGNLLSGAGDLNAVASQPGLYLLQVTDTTNGCMATDSVLITENSQAPSALASVNDILTCQVTSLTINAAGSSTGLNYELVWSSPQGHPFDDSNPLQLIVDQPGAYVLTITDLTNNCVSSATVQVQQDTIAPLAEAGPAFELNCTLPEAQLDGSASSQGLPFTYLWQTGDGTIAGETDILSPLATSGGLYVLSVANIQNGCVSVDSVLIAENKVVPMADAGPDGILNCGATSFAIQGQGTSAGNEFTYQWNADNGLILPPQPDPVIDDAGTYELIVTNTTNGCVSRDTVQVAADFALPTADAGAPDILNCYQPQLSLNGSASSQGAGFSYEWTTENGNILQGTTGLMPLVDQPGAYQLVVTNTINACRDTALVTLTEDFSFPVADAGQSFELNCELPEAGLDGSASSQGPEFEYAWSSADGTLTGDPGVPNPLVQSGGTYILSVVNTLNGCQSIDSVLITENKNYPVADAGPDGTLDCDSPSFTVAGQGSDTGPGFAYQWITDNGVTLPAVPSPTIQEAGVYELVITDTANGCTSRDTVQVFADFAVPVADAGPAVTLNCDQPQFSLDASASSQGPEFGYNWFTSDGNIIQGADTPNPLVDEPGLYHLVVTNLASACADTAQVAVDEDFNYPAADAGPPQEINCVQQVVTLGGFSASGPSITYQWTTNDGALSANTSVPDPGVNSGGTYVLTVTDLSNGCQSVDSVVITQDQNLPVAFAGSDFILNCATTVVTLDNQGTSTGPNFSYSWQANNGLSLPAALNPTIDEAGAYVLMVTNTDNQCSSRDTVVIAANFATPIADAGLPAILNCYQPELNLNGLASSQGPDLIYQWTTTAGNILSGSDGLTPLVDQPGVYQLEITNTSSSCSATAQVAISENFTEPSAAIAAPPQLTCTEPNVLLDGAASSSGPGFSYSWTTPDGSIVGGATQNTVIVEAAGTYILEVTDNENGCRASTQVVVAADQDLPLADPGPSVTLTCADPVLALDGSGSDSGPAISYHWATTNGLIVSGAQSTNPAVAGGGVYQLTVTNQETGCLSTASVTVTVDTLAPIANAGLAGVLTCSHPSIHLNGSGTSAGATFNYQWSGPGLTGGSTTLTPTINAPGTYLIQVTNTGNGCTQTDQVVVTIDTLAPTATIAAAPPLTCTTTSLTLTAEADGNAPLSYLWTTDDGQIGAAAASLTPTVSAPGLYELTVTNTGNGCLSTATLNVTIDTIAPLAEAGAVAQLDCDHPIVNLDGNLSDGGHHSYEWTTSDGAILEGHTGLTPAVDAPGTYWLTVTDLNNGCQSADAVMVMLNDTFPEVTIIPPNRLTCINQQVTLTGVSDESFDFQWFNANGQPIGLDGPSVIQVNQPGNYQLMVTNPENGCNRTEAVTVIQDITPPVADAGAGGMLNCEITTLQLDGSGSSQGPLFHYEWQTSSGAILSGESSPSALIGEPGLYELLVTNISNGCTAADAVIVEEIIPESAIITAAEPRCFGETGSLSILEVTGGQPPYLYSIDGGQQFGSTAGFNNLEPGLFEVVIQDANGCEIAEEVIIPLPVELQVVIAPRVTITVGDQQELNAQVNIPEEEIAEIRWTPEKDLSCTDCMSPIASPLETTTYRVNVTNKNGCQASADILLIVETAPVYIPSGFSPFNHDGTNDRLLVYAKESAVVKVHSLLIFNRWGETVFEVYNFPPNDPLYGWDGTYRGRLMNPGVFVYLAEVELVDGSRILLKGDVTLVK